MAKTLFVLNDDGYGYRPATVEEIVAKMEPSEGLVEAVRAHYEAKYPRRAGKTKPDALNGDEPFFTIDRKLYEAANIL